MPVEILRADGTPDPNLTGVVKDDVVRALNEDLELVNRQIGDDGIGQGLNPSKLRNFKATGIVLTTDQVQVQHGLGVTPHWYYVIPKTAGNWLEAREPDSQFVYVKTSTGSQTVDILIEG